MKPEGRRDIFCRARGKSRRQEQSQRDAANQGTAGCYRRLRWPALANRRSLKSPFRHAGKQRGLNPSECCAFRLIGSTGSLQLHGEALSAIRIEFFGQEFFDSQRKIKFRFFLVASLSGF
jgi:hypothetical protein